LKIGFDEIRLINALDSIARVSAKDCFVEENTIVYLVPNEGMRKAIGKNGSTIEKVKKQLGKNIELYEYSSKPEEFFSKAFYKASVEGIEIKKMKQRNVAIVKTDNTNKRAILQNLGRLNKIKELAKRNYNIEEVRIR
tara:strand:- start:4788 stop:5201 length:414 start_codon:yes stop_codon:yes gene_type:complete